MPNHRHWDPADPPQDGAISSGRAASDIISLLRERWPRLAMAVATGQLTWPYVKKGRIAVNDRRTYTIKVLGGPGSDGLFDELHGWVLSILPDSQQRSLIAFASRSATPRDFWDEDDNFRRRPRKADAIRLRYDGSREQKILVGNHKIRVSVADGGAAGENKAWRPPEIVFTAASIAGRDALLEHINQVLESTRSQSRQPCFRMLNKWDDWERIDDLPNRPLDSVILPPGQLERIVADLDRFLASENVYIRRSLPYHRGYLLEGPPGTGKTSAARALASHAGLDVWYLPLADVKKDTDLLKTVANIGSRAMLILEDIDIYHAATTRTDEQGTATLSGLLNSLDGFATPHGLVSVLTANKPGILDYALVRPGRIDMTEHFGLSGPAEAARIVTRWFDEPCPELPGKLEISAAEITEMLKQSADVADAVRRLIDADTTKQIASSFEVRGNTGS